MKVGMFFRQIRIRNFNSLVNDVEVRKNGVHVKNPEESVMLYV